MLRHATVAAAILIGATTGATAQDSLSPVGPQQTTWQLQSQPLDKLLGEGWFIRGQQIHALLLVWTEDRRSPSRPDEHAIFHLPVP